MTIHVLVADDQDLVRTGLAHIINDQPDMRTVGGAADGIQAVQQAIQHRPDVVLMDIRMPRKDGVEATRQLRANPALQCRILILTTFDLDEYVYEALHAGASGFLLKNTPTATLVDGIRTIAAGDGLLAPTVTGRLIQHITTRRPPPRAALDQLATLTPREAETLRHLATGASNAEIVATLGVANATVKTHVASILTKLDARDRSQAIVIAYQTGFAQPDAP